MTRYLLTFRTLVALWLTFILAAASGVQDARGQDPAQDSAAEGETAQSSTVAAPDGPAAAASAPASNGAQAPKHAAVLKDAKEISGLITLHQKGNNLYAELTSSDYNNEYIVLISIARGISQGSLLGGMSWGFGDDWVWSFRKIDENVHIVRKNVRFKATKGMPEATSVHNAYTDSVLFSLPVITKGPRGGDLVDLGPVFMSDLPQISRTLPGFVFASNKSTWAAVKGFPGNMELTVAATYASSGQTELDSVPDSRGATINVHYSISRIPQNGYTPRLADPRVGYFLTAVKDFSKSTDREQFVRYANRWHLEMPPGVTSAPTPPKKAILFYIEKTVPFKYRKAVREGIEEWNKAFETAGWLNAIEVRQQLDTDPWDPEDINYNTFRWITANAGFAMGPSRVNPYTGQILDADIIFDADFLQSWKSEFETLTPQSIASITGGALEYSDEESPADALFGYHHKHPECSLSRGMAMQMAFGSAALLARTDPKQLAETQERLIMQGLKEVTMHEVGHTLGLRHNFKASRYLSLQDMNNPEKTKQGMVASVMDYNPANIVPKDAKQGDFYTTTLGPYDIWAIQYGYTHLSGGTHGELAELQKIASRSGEPALAYATDEDTRGTDPDPDSNRFDLGDDPLEYAKLRAKLVGELMPDIVERMTKDGEDYTQARRAFNVLLSQHGQGMFFASRYIGGLRTSRSHKGDKDAAAPLSVVDAKMQRDALALLEEQVFSDKPYAFPGEVYGYLAASNWRHWGVSNTTRKDFPVHSYISMWQERVLSQLMSSVTLERLHDTEIKIPADQDAFTTAELIERLTRSIFSEVDGMQQGEYSNRQPAISSLRRNLQRIYLRRLSQLAMGHVSVPEDCKTMAFAELSALADRIEKQLQGEVKLDSYSQAHLKESHSRIQKVLEAQLSLSGP